MDRTSELSGFCGDRKGQKRKRSEEEPNRQSKRRTPKGKSAKGKRTRSSRSSNPRLYIDLSTSRSSSDNGRKRQRTSSPSSSRLCMDLSACSSASSSSSDSSSSLQETESSCSFVSCQCKGSCGHQHGQKRKREEESDTEVKRTTSKDTTANRKRQRSSTSGCYVDRTGLGSSSNPRRKRLRPLLNEDICLSPSPSQSPCHAPSPTPISSSGSSSSTSSSDSSSRIQETESSCSSVSCQCKAEFAEKYIEEQCLGSGGFGRVFAGYRKEGLLPVAIKHIPLHKADWTTITLDGQQQKVPKEVALLRMVGRGDTPARNVIGLLDWYRLSKEVLLVLERPVPCKDLCDFLEDEEDWLVEDEAKVIMRQLVEATLDIHSRGVVHRDLKPKNVLVETGSGHPRVHVIDFGCGSVLREKPYTSFSGTRAYTAPEWYQKHEFYAEPSTVWQLGVVLHQMVTGERPFNGEEEIVHKKLDLWRFVSRDCQDLLRRCLDKRPLARPTMAEILQHPWLQ